MMIPIINLHYSSTCLPSKFYFNFLLNAQPIILNSSFRRMRSCIARLCWSFAVLQCFYEPTVFALSTIQQVHGLRVDKAPLRPKDPTSAYSFVLASAMDLMGDGDNSNYSHVNFLATQVWPSARVAASQIERHAARNKIHSLCELGCGPGLPTITAAKIRIPQVWATDIDEFALSLVRSAAEEQ